MGSRKVAYERVEPELLESDNNSKKFKILPCFFCEIEQNPIYNGIDFSMTIQLDEAIGVSEYAEYIKTGVKGYPSKEDIAAFLSSLGNTKFYAAVDGATLIVSLRLLSSTRFLGWRKLHRVIDFIKRCIKYPVHAAPDMPATRKKIIMASRVSITVKSRWKHETVAKKIRFMFREFKNRRDC